MVAEILWICKFADRASHPPCKKHCKYHVLMWNTQVLGPKQGGGVANREPIYIYIYISFFSFLFFILYYCIISDISKFQIWSHGLRLDTARYTVWDSRKLSNCLVHKVVSDDPTRDNLRSARLFLYCNDISLPRLVKATTCSGSGTAQFQHRLAAFLKLNEKFYVYSLSSLGSCKVCVTCTYLQKSKDILLTNKGRSVREGEEKNS